MESGLAFLKLLIFILSFYFLGYLLIPRSDWHYHFFDKDENDDEKNKEQV